jgi:hypothetical protein
MTVNSRYVHVIGDLSILGARALVIGKCLELKKRCLGALHRSWQLQLGGCFFYDFQHSLQ